MTTTHRVAVLLFAVLAAISAPMARAKQPVTFSTTDRFAVLASAQAVVVTSTRHLSVVFERISLKGHPNSSMVMGLTGFRVGLARQTPDSKWEVTHWSDLSSLNQRVGPGASVELKDLSRIIATDGAGSLEDRWLVLEVGITFGGRTGTVYAHSADKLSSIQTKD